MPTIKLAEAPETAKSSEHFSLVPAAAQRQMYKALAALQSATPYKASGAEVAEIAACVASGERDPVILACPAHGARLVRRAAKVAGGKNPAANVSRMTVATLSAIEALLNDSNAAALICAGKLDAHQDYRSAFSFAARHKIAILFLVANTLAPGRRQAQDLYELSAEFAIPVFSVDATDAIAVYRVATEALHNARHLRGPCVIEALTVKSKGGSTAGALDLLRSYMERHGNWPLHLADASPASSSRKLPRP